MQETDVTSFEDARVSDSSRATRLLEDSDKLIIEVNGMVLATLEGRMSLAVPRNNGGLCWLEHHYKTLHWSPLAMQLILQGVSLKTLFSDKFCLLGGTHRPVYHPRPGIDQVVLAEVTTLGD